jgi:hypothetical protein
MSILATFAVSIGGVKAAPSDWRVRRDGIVFGREQDQGSEHDFLGLLASRVQRGNPGEAVLAGRAARWVRICAHRRVISLAPCSPRSVK